MTPGYRRSFYDFPNLRLVLDVSDVQNRRQEDDFASSITLLAFALHRLKMTNIAQKPRPFHSVKGMLCF